MYQGKFAVVRTQIPGPKSKVMLKEWKQYETDKTGFQASVAIHHGLGALLFDEDDNSFIDWTSGVLVTNVGHCHPRLVKAIREASERILNVYEFCNIYRTKAAKDLVEAAPAHLDTCFFLTTGSEATDTAMRIMKRVTGKFELVSFYGGFHGRTLSTASAGGLARTKKGFGPVTPGFIRVPYPYCYRCPFKSDPYQCNFMCLEFLDDVVRANSVDSLAGLIVEPYLGTAGFIFPPVGYLPKLEQWCREQKIIFTLDEVQSSYGRTGTLWAQEHERLTPDIITVGKGIGSGVAVSALLMRREMVDKAIGKGDIGSTYGGNPVSCAAVSAVLEIIRTENILSHVLEVEQLFASRLAELSNCFEIIGDVRGKGLVWGIELVENKATKVPAPALTQKLVGLCAEKGLLIGNVGIFGNVIRIAPPLVISAEQADESLDIFKEVLQEIAR